MAEIIQIDSHTWRFEDGYVRFFLLEGDDRAVMIDSGIACENASEIASFLTDKPVMLLNTHGDRDHTSGTNGFKEIHMHIEDYNNCGIKLKYPNTTLTEVKDGDTIDLGNRPLEIMHIPGHTKGSVTILDVNNRSLYAGDSVQKGHIFMFGGHRDTEAYEASLDKIISIKDKYDRIYASHDEYLVPADYAEKVKDAWRQVRAGKVQYEMVNLHGMDVKSYTTDVCGFYIE